MGPPKIDPKWMRLRIEMHFHNHDLGDSLVSLDLLYTINMVRIKFSSSVKLRKSFPSSWMTFLPFNALKMNSGLKFS